MSAIKRSVARFPADMVQAWLNWHRLIAKAMSSSSFLAVLFTITAGIFLGLGFIGVGDAVAGDDGAWIGSAVGIVVGGLFVGRVLDEL